ncbi:MAG TPA: hypothetical protein VFE18_11030 [Phenylobacterium sp.]|jgi:hypothetical protein|uniref:hypothetical protein n=1 Tax=Phenylobacterium sp. TaxID=1871053 RepID=UPI002D436D80|nr:hypothetical protein [Phenylobacterium sp.]HZZ68694.1 hypothetical protein [Phenylobacterium sp.]
MSNDEYLPQQVTVDVAFGAMAQFLALHFNGSPGTREVAAFIKSISNDRIGRPASNEVFELFKEAVVRADRLEMVGLREPSE